MGKRDRDKKVRHHANLWLKNHKSDVDALATAAGLPAERLREWIGDDGKQLSGQEQLPVMKVVGLKESDLPEILVHDFRKNGYLPEVLLNFLALLGWNPGGDRERMSMDELVQLFSIDGIGKSNAKFNREKLLAFNTEACAAAPMERLVRAMRDYLSVNPDSPLNRADDAALARLLEMKKGFRTLREVDETSRFFYVPDDQIEYDPAAVDKVLKKGDGQGLAALRDVRQVLNDAQSWTAQSLDAAVKQYCDQKQLGLGKVAQPIRVAVSGTTISPPIFESLELLGKEATLKRINRCIGMAS
jgi:glutamyl-tRNA synthetase